MYNYTFLLGYCFLFCLTRERMENPMDGGAWYAVVHGVAKSRTD